MIQFLEETSGVQIRKIILFEMVNFEDVGMSLSHSEVGRLLISGLMSNAVRGRMASLSANG